MASAREDLEYDRERILEELKVRSDRVKEIDAALASNQYVLERSGPGAGLRSGSAVQILAGAARRNRLKAEHERLKSKRAEALEDLRRAEERLEQVDQELRAIESGSDV